MAMDVLNFLDWSVILAYLCVAMAIGLYFKNSSKQSLEHFFLGGKNIPWYLAGLSMVATTFAADTPLLVTEVVAQNGISGNWIWWNMAIGGLLTTFLFAKLWKRADVLTELEFIDLRYGKNKPARYLKYFKALYLGGLMNLLIMGWVNLAMLKILTSFFSLDASTAYLILSALMFITLTYASLSGLKGVIFTDVFQFVLAMVGCILLSYYLLGLEAIGGIQGLVSQLPKEKLDFIPQITNEHATKAFTITWATFFSFVAMQWWASWYPGAEPGGGGYVAQRIMSTKNERHAFLSTFLFQIGHYCLRPWPWILTALCALVLYPDLKDPAQGFVLAMKDHLPNGLKGLMIVSFLSAYMSTISTQLNWGSALIINDFIKPLSKNKAQTRHVVYGKISTLALALCSILITTQMRSIKEMWEILLGCGAGLGLVLILRWYSKHINVWSEISASLAPFLIYPFCKKIMGLDHTSSFFITTLGTTFCWIIITFITPKTDQNIILNFYKKVRIDKENTLNNITNWIVAVFLIYATLFFIGAVIFKHYDISLKLVIIMILLGLFLFWSTKKQKAL